MATYYVRKTGNDTTGDGSSGNPWLTIGKALSVITSGDALGLGDAAWSETNGSGKLTFSTAYTSEVIIFSESGNPDACVITGTTGSAATGAASNLTFHNIGFTQPNNTVLRTFQITSATASNVRFIGCKYVILANSAQVNAAVDCPTTGNWTNFQWLGCEVKQAGPWRTQGFYIPSTSVGSVADSWVWHDNKVVTAGYTMRLDGLTNVRITKNRLTTFGWTLTDHCFQLGVDGTTGNNTISGIVEGNIVLNANGHAMLIGAGCDRVVVRKNEVTSGRDATIGLGIVVKQCKARVIKNTIIARGGAGLYFKAATDSTGHSNEIYVQTATAVGLRVDYDPTNSAPAARVSARRNTIHAGIGTAVLWGTNAAADSGGSVCDENVYIVTGAGVLGSVLGITVSTLSQMRAAWTTAGYDTPNNDRKSKIKQEDPPFSGTPSAVLV